MEGELELMKAREARAARARAALLAQVGDFGCGCKRWVVWWWEGLVVVGIFGCVGEIWEEGCVWACRVFRFSFLDLVAMVWMGGWVGGWV